MPRWNIEKENEQYVLRALAELKNGSGVKGIHHKVNDLLKHDDSRRQLTERQAQAVIDSLEAQGKIARQRNEPGDPPTWQITSDGKKYLTRE